jgi:hypothetical protein
MSWKNLRGCSVIEANLACGLLEDANYAARVVDGSGQEYLRDNLVPTDYPVIVQVREEDFGSASAFLDLARPSKTKAVTESAPSPRLVAQPAPNSAEAIGRRIRFCAVTPLAPVGLWLAPEYLSRTRAAEKRPAQHRWNLAGSVVCALVTPFYALWIYTAFFR